MDPILTLFDTYRDAVWDKDIELFMSLYAPDFRGFDLWGDWEQPDLAALRSAVHAWFGGLAEDRGDEHKRVGHHKDPVSE